MLKLVDKHHKCLFCAKAFARRHDMLRHERTVHAQQKALICVTCSVAFNDQETLLLHCATENHTAPEKPQVKQKQVPRRKMKKSGHERVSSTSSITNIFPSAMQISDTPPDGFRSLASSSSMPSAIYTPDQQISPNVFPSTQIPNQMYGVYPNPNTQQYVAPLPDATYMRYSEPTYFNNAVPYMQQPQPRFIPDMSQSGYQMTTSMPSYTDKASRRGPPSHISTTPSLDYDIPNQPLHPSNLKNTFFPDENRSQLFDDSYFPGCDGLIIHENHGKESSVFPELPASLLHADVARYDPNFATDDFNMHLF